MAKKEQKPSKKPSEPENSSSLKKYARYSGMAFQMLAIILIFLWAGRKLDEHAGREKPLYTAILTLLGVIVSLYITLKDLISSNND